MPLPVQQYRRKQGLLIGRYSYQQFTAPACALGTTRDSSRSPSVPMRSSMSVSYSSARGVVGCSAAQSGRGRPVRVLRDGGQRRGARRRSPPARRRRGTVGGRPPRRCARACPPPLRPVRGCRGAAPGAAEGPPGAVPAVASGAGGGPCPAVLPPLPFDLASL